ncbi:Ig-like domain-containing protein [Sporosarcina sp. P18a]|uniref:Ig-like domain-containing protein n=1 Tax=Sporosarcina sp. P18a TaxID=2048259 RepID=UPI0013040C15|nr:Ig-like domain-containing protein [Sporosarcina sp. P18a]
MKTSNVLFFTLFIMIVTSMTVTPQKSFAQNEIKMNDAETTVTHVLDQSTRLFNTALVNEIDSEKTGATKYFSANTHAHFFWLSLKDSEYNAVTGIKASRLEMIQQGQVVARANQLDSYSVIGQYQTRHLEKVNTFQHVNGENTIDIVLYLGSKEVARVKDFRVHVYEKPAISFVNPYQIGVQSEKFGLSLEMLNVDKSQAVDIYLRDEENNRITKTDKIVTDYYNEDESTRRMDFGLSFIDPTYLQEFKMYDLVVEVNEQVIQNPENEEVYLAEDSYIDTTFHAQISDLRYRGLGINLLHNNPYRIVIEQDGQVTKELNDIQAFFNEETYKEEINVMLMPEYFMNYGGAYTIKVYNALNKEMKDFDFLVEKDVVNENDMTNPFEGFKMFEKREDIKPAKTWSVTFNKAVDENTINNSNTYIIEIESGKSIKVDYTLQKGGTVLEITPLKNFTSGATYTLIVDQRVTSGAGKQLSEPAAIEFTVK